jgi:hypothetical protein
MCHTHESASEFASFIKTQPDVARIHTRIEFVPANDAFVPGNTLLSRRPIFLAAPGWSQRSRTAPVVAATTMVAAHNRRTSWMHAGLQQVVFALVLTGNAARHFRRAQSKHPVESSLSRTISSRFLPGLSHIRSRQMG